MPWLVLVALTIRPGAFRDFYQSRGGAVVVVAGAALSGARIVVDQPTGPRAEEQRVFAATTPSEVSA